MKYNTQYLDVKYALIKTFLINADKDLLDVSYDLVNENLKVQVVLIEESNYSNQLTKTIKEYLTDWDVELIVLYVSKVKFNENKGEWNPKAYNWLRYLLFSKAEVL